jgi:hypothetical protein
MLQFFGFMFAMLALAGIAQALTRHDALRQFIEACRAEVANHPKTDPRPLVMS